MFLNFIRSGAARDAVGVEWRGLKDILTREEDSNNNVNSNRNILCYNAGEKPRDLFGSKSA